MEYNQRLSERITTSFEDMRSDDLNWNQFVRDHKEYIKSNSNIKTFDRAKVARYRYRPEEFYVDNDGDKQATWIFLFVNDIRDAADFNENKTSFIIPPKLKLRELWRIYSASANSSLRDAD